MTLAASMVTNTAAANTASLPQSIGNRRGTAVSEERIMPVLYSPVISSTPSAPMASWAMKVPVRLVEIGFAAGPKVRG